MTGEKLSRVFDLNADDTTFRDEVAKAMVADFVTALGLDVKRFLVGAPLTVFRSEDGSFLVRTWLAVNGEDGDTFPLCENCPGCIKQEQVDVPLTARVPAITGSSFWPGEEGSLRLVQHPDHIAAAESAYRAALEEQARAVAQPSRAVQRAQADLAAAQLGAVSTEVTA
jgi:hypothetical protein